MVLTRGARNQRASCSGRMQSEDTESLPDGSPASNCPTSPTLGMSGHGHIKVAVRVRPLPQNEAGIIEVADNQTVLIEKLATNGGNGFLSSQHGRIETRAFDHAFGPQASQREVYESTCAPLLTEAISGGRCATIFAYGATGAGKTHTIFGTPEEEQQGIILRAIPDIFRAVAELNEKSNGSESTLQVKASFLEIYNETVRDLLRDPADGGALCRVLEDERRGIVQVSNVLEPAVTSADDALQHLQTGSHSRTVEATAANTQSSRSHAVFTLTIERVVKREAQRSMRSRLTGGDEQRQLHSKISFIDLAGSERASLTQNVGQALKDGARINQSLLALANCIDALIAQTRLATTSAPRKKAPYRDSKLTLMLKGSLMGDGLVAMIANVHPGQLHFEDSNNTLEYAKRASAVKASTRRRQSTGCDNASTAASRAQLDDVEDLENDSAPVNLEQIGMESKIGRPRNAFHMGSPTADSCVSASSLPKPRRSARASNFPASSPAKAEMIRGTLQLPQFYTNLPKSASSCEITTASSPEECPSSPISLSSGHDAAEEATLLQDAPGLGAAAMRNGDISIEIVAAELVAKLHGDNQKMDARLRLVTCERNALLKDRQALEEENESLREENMEKDRQILALLGRCCK